MNVVIQGCQASTDSPVHQETRDKVVSTVFPADKAYLVVPAETENWAHLVSLAWTAGTVSPE